MLRKPHISLTIKTISLNGEIYAFITIVKKRLLASLPRNFLILISRFTRFTVYMVNLDSFLSTLNLMNLSKAIIKLYIILQNNYTFEFLPGKQLMPNTIPSIFTLNHNIAQQASNIATHFAKEFEFVRVDFYHHDDKLYFSECTFTPGALKKIKWGSTGQHLSSFWV